MINHTDYPLHGKCELVYPDELVNGKYLEIVNFRTLQVSNSGDRTFICTSLFCFGIKHYEVFRLHYYLGILNHLGESESEVFIRRFDSCTRNSFPGPRLLESKVLHEKNGWLKDGKLSVVFGIHVEAFKETIWKFNFHEPAFRSCKNSFFFGHKEDKLNTLYSHKLLLFHHFPTVLAMDQKYVGVQDYFKLDSLEKCLQIIHGARIRIDLNDLFKVLKMAHYFNLYNVIRYCEMELIQRKNTIKFIRNHIQFATHYKLSRYLGSVLRDMESPEAIKEDFRHVDIGSITGEMMKQCVMYLLKI